MPKAPFAAPTVSPVVVEAAPQHREKRRFSVLRRHKEWLRMIPKPISNERNNESVSVVGLGRRERSHQDGGKGEESRNAERRQPLPPVAGTGIMTDDGGDLLAFVHVRIRGLQI
jgi:hypothetical protein